MSDLWDDVRHELSEVRESYTAGEMSPTSVEMRVPAGSSASALLDALVGDKRSAWVHFTCAGARGQRSHETGERVRFARTDRGVELHVAQPTRITAEDRVERWGLDCPVCGRNSMWRNPTDLAVDVLRGLAEWEVRGGTPSARGKCRVSWLRA